MALLSNNLETIELGATAWRDIINSNLEKIVTILDDLTNRIQTLEDSTSRQDDRITNLQNSLNTINSRVSALEARP